MSDRPSPRNRDSDGRASPIRSQKAISIDSQSFVNVGQLMGSRAHSVTTGVSSNLAGSCSIISCSDSDGDGLRDFDQVVLRDPSGGAWSGHERCSEERYVDQEEDDDNESVLPALPHSPPPGSPVGSDVQRRFSSTKRLFNHERELGWSHNAAYDTRACASCDCNRNRGDDSVYHGEDSASHHELDLVVSKDRDEDAQCGKLTVISSASNEKNDDRDSSLRPRGTRESLHLVTSKSSTSSEAKSTMETASASAAAGTMSSLLPESWLHVPVVDEQMASAHETPQGPTVTGERSASVQEAHQEVKEDGAQVEGAGIVEGMRVCANSGCCLVCGMEKIISLARPSLQSLARLVKAQLGTAASMLTRWQEAFVRGHEVFMKAVDGVPQAPGNSRLLEISRIGPS